MCEGATPLHTGNSLAISLRNSPKFSSYLLKKIDGLEKEKLELPDSSEGGTLMGIFGTFSLILISSILIGSVLGWPVGLGLFIILGLVVKVER